MMNFCVKIWPVWPGSNYAGFDLKLLTLVDYHNANV